MTGLIGGHGQGAPTKQSLTIKKQPLFSCHFLFVPSECGLQENVEVAAATTSAGFLKLRRKWPVADVKF